MSRRDRHDQILIARRRRHRAKVNRPRPFLRFFQVLAVVLVVGLVVNVSVMAAGTALAVGLYNSYADQLPDASIIEVEQDDFQTVRIYDRTGEHLAIRKC